MTAAAPLDDSADGAPAARHAPPVPLVAAAVSVTTLLGVVVVRGRNLWFASDDWNIITQYPSGNLLEPFNGHLSLVPVAVYQSLFRTAGISDYLPYRIAGLVALAVLAFQVYRYGAGRAGAAVAALVVSAVLWNSFGSTNLMFPFLMNFSLPLAALAAIWWHLDRDTPRHDVTAGLWLAFALACSGLGLMALAAVVVELAWSRASWRRWVAFAPAAGLWFVWWLGHRDASEVSTDLPAVVRYAARMFWGATTSLAAGWKPGGAVLAVAFLALLAVAALRWHSVDGRTLGALAAPAAFIVLTAATRIDIVPAIPPDELRYGWTIAAYLLLAVVAMWRPTDGDREAMRGRAPVAIGVAVAVIALGGAELLGDVDRWVGEVEGNTPGVRTNLYAAEAVGADRVDPDIVMPLSFVPVTTGRYLAAVEQLGSPLQGWGSDAFGGRADQLDAADRVLRSGLAPALEAGPGAGDPGGCSPELELADGATVALEVGDGGGAVVARRFGDEPVATLDVAEGPAAVRIGADAPVGTDVVIPWRLEARGAVQLCG